MWPLSAEGGAASHGQGNYDTQRTQRGRVGKKLRRDSRYEPGGVRSGAWRKMRVNSGQEFVIAGYTIGSPFDALVLGYYEQDRLIYAARTRNGYTPASRAALAKKFPGLEIPTCPFVNLPGDQGRTLGARTDGKPKMKDCRWLRPELAGQSPLLTRADHGFEDHCRAGMRFKMRTPGRSLTNARAPICQV
jgi:hypothetical protein